VRTPRQSVLSHELAQEAALGVGWAMPTTSSHYAQNGGHGPPYGVSGFSGEILRRHTSQSGCPQSPASRGNANIAGHQGEIR